jgi:hypothetical protein
VFNPSPSIVLSAHNDIKSYLGFAFFGVVDARGPKPSPRSKFIYSHEIRSRGFSSILEWI